MEHWVETQFVNLPSEAFFNDIEAVCRRYNVSLSHEDRYGSFVIMPFDQDNMAWLRVASFSVRAAQIINGE